MLIVFIIPHVMQGRITPRSAVDSNCQLSVSQISITTFPGFAWCEWICHSMFGNSENCNHWFMQNHKYIHRSIRSHNAKHWRCSVHYGQCSVYKQGFAAHLRADNSHCMSLTCVINFSTSACETCRHTAERANLKWCIV